MLKISFEGSLKDENEVSLELKSSGSNPDIDNRVPV